MPKARGASMFIKRVLENFSLQNLVGASRMLARKSIGLRGSHEIRRWSGLRNNKNKEEVFLSVFNAPENF